jgi:phosphate transport system protein
VSATLWGWDGPAGTSTANWRPSRKVIELLGLVVEDLAVATRALLGNGGETAWVLVGREQLIDALYVEIEDLAVRGILLQAPVASDLRFLLTVLRVVPELERSHDLIVHVASQAPLLRGGDLPQRVTGLAGRMADLVSVMWRQAADVWYGRDRSVAEALGRRRDEMSELHAALTAEIAAERPARRALTLCGDATPPALRGALAATSSAR